MQKFLIIETFEDEVIPIYQRLRDSGREMPPGVRYVDSWIEVSLKRCFQIMEAESHSALQQWVLLWQGLGIGFEIIPVVPSKDTQANIAPHLT